jgi:uncharacterized protein YjaZ
MVSADEATPLEELPPFLQTVDLSAMSIPCLVVHELVHYQQVYSGAASLLNQALREGVADFLAMRTVHCTAAASVVYEYGDAHEAALWSEFQEAMRGTDLQQWLYNGPTSPDRPANLGYWMGYQIAEAYFAKASDKEQAVYDLLHVSDPAQLLARSGYAGGN